MKRTFLILLCCVSLNAQIIDLLCLLTIGGYVDGGTITYNQFVSVCNVYDSSCAESVATTVFQDTIDHVRLGCLARMLKYYCPIPSGASATIQAEMAACGLLS